MGGTLHPGLDGGTPILLTRGVPHQDWMRVPPIRTGCRYPLSELDGGTPLFRTGWGYPLPVQDWMGSIPLISKMVVPSACPGLDGGTPSPCPGLDGITPFRIGCGYPSPCSGLDG